MGKIILIKLTNRCPDKECESFVMWVKKEAYNIDEKYWGFDRWERVEPEKKIPHNFFLSTLPDKIHHKINRKHREKENSKSIFDNEPITKLAEKPGKMFNVKIQVTDSLNYLSSTVTFFDDLLHLNHYSGLNEIDHLNGIQNFTCNYTIKQFFSKQKNNLKTNLT